MTIQSDRSEPPRQLISGAGPLADSGFASVPRNPAPLAPGRGRLPEVASAPSRATPPLQLSHLMHGAGVRGAAADLAAKEWRAVPRADRVTPALEIAGVRPAAPAEDAQSVTNRAQQPRPLRRLEAARLTGRI